MGFATPWARANATTSALIVLKRANLNVLTDNLQIGTSIRRVHNRIRWATVHGVVLVISKISIAIARADSVPPANVTNFVN